MYRLIIVDNEPNIVRGIRQLITEEAPFELDVYTAFSAEEALQLLDRMKIDIALLDIRMPGMNGLELQARIVEQWPSCKVIFLSGYDDFSYIQTAMRGGSVDYILKTDGDEAIIGAIQKAIDELSQATETTQLIEQAKRQLYQSLAPLQKDYIEQLLDGIASVKQHRLDELNIPLGAHDGPLLVLGRVDRWDASHSEADQALMHYAIQNIAAEYWTGSRHIIITLGSSTYAALLQPGPGDRWSGHPDRWIRFVHGQLESIQAACKRYLRLSVSFAASRGLVEWKRLPFLYSELKGLLFYGFGKRTEMLLTDDVALNFGQAGAGDAALQARNQLKRLLAADIALDSRYAAMFDELAALSLELAYDKPFLHEMYTGVAYHLLSYMNQHTKQDDPAVAADAYRKLHALEAHRSWEEAVDYLRGVIGRLKAARDRESEAGAEFLVAKLKSYIEHHLNEDLSLVRLAEIVYLNPTYLSRLFKQQSGEGVSQYITNLRLNKSRELLQYSSLRIQDIAAKVGFDSATSFGRFFKREMQITPQEYRERHENHL